MNDNLIAQMDPDRLVGIMLLSGRGKALIDTINNVGLSGSHWTIIYQRMRF
jgi:hypothetical protein